MAERLLIIDDDARLAAMVSDYLTGAGFTVDCRFTGREGLAAAAEQKRVGWRCAGPLLSW